MTVSVQTVIGALSDVGRAVSLDDLVHLQATVAPNVTPGVRVVQNWVGGPGYSPVRADFVPPPPEYVPALLEDLLEYVNSFEGSPIVHAALVHAQFETIHPFVDGNGRTGRALIHTILRRRDATRNALIPLSTVFAARTSEYLAGLTAFRSDVPDINSWVSGFAVAVQIASEQAVELTSRIVRQQERCHAQFVRWRSGQGIVPAVPRRGSAVAKILHGLPNAPVLTPNSIVATYGGSRQAAHRGLDELVRAGVLHRVRDNRDGRALCYAANELLDLLASTERSNAVGGGRSSTCRGKVSLGLHCR